MESPTERASSEPMLQYGAFQFSNGVAYRSAKNGDIQSVRLRQVEYEVALLIFASIHTAISLEMVERWTHKESSKRLETTTIAISLISRVRTKLGLSANDNYGVTLKNISHKGYLLCPDEGEEEDMLEFSNYRFDTAARKVYRSGSILQASDKEYDLALYLFLNEGTLLSTEEILRDVWNISAEIKTQRVKTYINRVTSLFGLTENDDNGFHIQNVYKRGYKLIKTSS